LPASNSKKARRNPNPAAAGSEPAAPLSVDSPNWTRNWPGSLLLWAGWLLPQFVLLGPALVGQTVDYPVDLLALPGVYLPKSMNVVPHHGFELTDLMFCYPEARDFSAKELRAGRLPLWYPQNFAGAPFAGWGVYSPFELPYYLVPSPITVAWIWLLQSITIGLGMWLFLRRCLDLSYWPSALASWCVPLTGFMTLWHGFSPVSPACWLLWLFVAIESAVKKPWGWGCLGVAVLTALVLVAGHIGIAGLVLLTTGFYALWRLFEPALKRQWLSVLSPAAGIGLGWLLGFALAAPALLPQVEYSRTGSRMDLHSAGIEERPPQGLVALPSIVRPDVYGGQTRANWVRDPTSRTGLLESASGAYAGLLAALWLAPLAFFHPKLRSQTILMWLLIVVSLGWTLNVPGLIDFLRSKPMRPLLSLSYNRWVFATSDAILILAAIGLDALRVRTPRFRWGWSVPIIVTVLFFGWCIYRFFGLTPELKEAGLSRGLWIGAGLSLMALVGWGTTFWAGGSVKWVRLAVIALLPLELLGFAWDERRQADMKLYYPRIPILEELAALPQGRIWGVGCFRPCLNETQGLDDVRGYDGVDPRDYIKLFELAMDQQRTPFIPYARTQPALPAARVINNVAKLHPVTDLLNVRYLIFREAPQVSLPIILHQDDYWIAANRNALPRAFVPHSVQVVKSDKAAIGEIASFDFDPQKTAFMTDKLNLPDTMRGTASVRYDTPAKAILDVDMQTPGLVVLSDYFYPGWRAELDGTECPIYRVDLALRGFQVPAGTHRIVCTFAPASVRTGFRAAAVASAMLLLWAIWIARPNLRNRWWKNRIDATLSK
jgi:hypothetical protein